MLLTPLPAGGSDYDDFVYNYFVSFEGNRRTIYLDTNGNPTIGVGFNLRSTGTNINANLTNILNMYYRFDEYGDDSQYKTDIQNAINSSNFSEVNNILTRRVAAYASAGITIVRVNGGDAGSFYLNNGSDSSIDESRPIFDNIIGAYEDNVTTYLNNQCGHIAFGSSLERLALVSLAYNAQQGELNLLGQGLATAIRNDDRAEAWFEIRYRSNGDQLPGIAKRRYYESDIFGLYSEGLSDDQKILEYKQAFRMYTKHENRINWYDAYYAAGMALAQAIENPICPIKTTSVQLNDAKIALETEYVDEIRQAAQQALASGVPSNPVLNAYASYHLDDVFVAAETRGTDGGEVAAFTVDRTAQDAKNDLIFSGLEGHTLGDVFDYYTLLAGAGDDIIVPGAYHDYVDGGDGIDILSFHDSTMAVTVDLAAGVGHGGYAEGDHYANLEAVFGSNFADCLIGGGEDNCFFLGEGDNVAMGGGGNDTLLGGKNRFFDVSCGIDPN